MPRRLKQRKSKVSPLTLPNTQTNQGKRLSQSLPSSPTTSPRNDSNATRQSTQGISSPHNVSSTLSPSSEKLLENEQSSSSVSGANDEAKIGVKTLLQQVRLVRVYIQQSSNDEDGVQKTLEACQVLNIIC